MAAQPHLPRQSDLILLSTSVCIAEILVNLLKLKMEINKKRRRERVTKDYSSRCQGITMAYISECMDDKYFALAFRMKRATFEKLLDLSESSLKRKIMMGERSNRPTILPPICLALCLRMMANASVHAMVTTFHVDRQTAYENFRDTRHALKNLLKFSGIPTNFHDLKKMAEDFQVSRSPSNPLPGCIGALDGISIPIKKLTKDPAAYWCRKGYCALPVQAVCDSNYRFLCFSAMCKGATHDYLAHSVLALGRYLEEEGLAEQFWLAVDEAYVCTTCLITPVPGSQAKDDDDAFNFYHSSTRMHIEQAFGMACNKWTILRYVNYSVKEAGLIIGLTMKLSNVCIDHNGTMPLSAPQSEIHRKAIEDSEDWFQEGKHIYLKQIGQPGVSKRNHLIEIIKKGNFRRPPVCPVRVPEHLRLVYPDNTERDLQCTNP